MTYVKLYILNQWTIIVCWFDFLWIWWPECRDKLFFYPCNPITVDIWIWLNDCPYANVMQVVKLPSLIVYKYPCKRSLKIILQKVYFNLGFYTWGKTINQLPIDKRPLLPPCVHTGNWGNIQVLTCMLFISEYRFFCWCDGLSVNVAIVVYTNIF